MTDENVLADRLAFVLAGRAERLSDLAAAQMPAAERAALAAVIETVATLALSEEPVAPSASLRTRVLASFGRARARTPRRALVVCDMIVDHLVPGRPMEVPRARAIVDALANRIAGARAAGVPVVYVVDRHAPDDPEFDEWGSHAVEGTEGADVCPPLAPQPGDRVVTKPSYSAFFGSELESVLEALSVDTLVLTGCATEVQLLATGTDALQRGFALEMPPDTQAGASEVGERVALAVLSGLAPFVPARRARLARLKSAAEEA